MMAIERRIHRLQEVGRMGQAGIDSRLAQRL